ncbi:sulfotransferase [Qipengyuania sp. JC766]|uniref:sulfotransferase family protein n=1 Tax=Qipengyuania sp. JC766 TaxID=3232139 RepID=UPI00345A6D8F
MSGFTGRYVFVAGLHRTGTSILARLLAQHPEVATISHSPAPENEGCYLQGAIPHTALHGIPGHYATDPEQHLTEECRFDTLETRTRLEQDWDRWFEEGGQWRLEKSPVNLTRMRLYQQLFPLSQFVVILRHPAVMAAALAKWTDTPSDVLIDYALDAYEQTLADCEYLHAAMVVRYEDLVASPSLSPFWQFLSLPEIENDVALKDGNADYPAVIPFSAEQDERARRFGYGTGGAAKTFEPVIRHPLRTVREATLAAFRPRA